MYVHTSLNCIINRQIKCFIRNWWIVGLVFRGSKFQWMSILTEICFPDSTQLTGWYFQCRDCRLFPICFPLSYNLPVWAIDAISSSSILILELLETEHLRWENCCNRSTNLRVVLCLKMQIERTRSLLAWLLILNFTRYTDIIASKGEWWFYKHDEMGLHSGPEVHFKPGGPW